MMAEDEQQHLTSLWWLTANMVTNLHFYQNIYGRYMLWHITNQSLYFFA